MEEKAHQQPKLLHEELETESSWTVSKISDFLEELRKLKSEIEKILQLKKVSTVSGATIIRFPREKKAWLYEAINNITDLLEEKIHFDLRKIEKRQQENQGKVYEMFCKDREKLLWKRRIDRNDRKFDFDFDIFQKIRDLINLIDINHQRGDKLIEIYSFSYHTHKGLSYIMEYGLGTLKEYRDFRHTQNINWQESEIHELLIHLWNQLQTLREINLIPHMIVLEDIIITSEGIIKLSEFCLQYSENEKSDLAEYELNFEDLEELSGKILNEEVINKIKQQASKLENNPMKLSLIRDKSDFLKFKVKKNLSKYKRAHINLEVFDKTPVS